MLEKFDFIYRKIRQHWLTVGFILGFFTDIILLNKIDSLVDNLVLLFYALLATTALLLLYAGVAEKGPASASRLFRKYAPILMQYAFGGLLSGMLIFYGRSGDWLASAPFFILILAVILGNEFVSKRSDRLIYHVGLYFIGLYSYIVLVVPVIIGKMGDGIFILSGLIALMIVTFVVQVLYRIVPNFMVANTTRIILTIGGIFIGFNTLYFTNIIPPIPLSLTELEVVHSVNRTPAGDYRISIEVQPWYSKLPLLYSVIHPTENSISCFAKVFAPTRLSTEIFHRWQYQDANGDWQDKFRLGYEISGASEGGYRGYTSIQSFFTGKWRCSVETKRGQVLGQNTFYINTISKPQEIVVRIE